MPWLIYMETCPFLKRKEEWMWAGKRGEWERDWEERRKDGETELAGGY